MTRVHVLGLGNVLMGDDGFGPQAARVLEATYKLPDEVRVMDVGTPGLDLIPFLSGADRLVILDTVRALGRPGEVRLYGREDLLRSLLRPRLGPHDPGLSEALSILELSGERRQTVLLVGVIPERVATGIGLSPAVRAAVPIAVEAVALDLARQGVSLRRRENPRPADIWWEAERPRPNPEEARCTKRASPSRSGA